MKFLIENRVYERGDYLTKNKLKDFLESKFKKRISNHFYRCLRELEKSGLVFVDRIPSGENLVYLNKSKRLLLEMIFHYRNPIKTVFTKRGRTEKELKYGKKKPTTRKMSEDEIDKFARFLVDTDPNILEKIGMFLENKHKNRKF